MTNIRVSVYELAEMIASNYLNGNISDARKYLLDKRKPRARAAALAIMVGDLLDNAERERWNLAVLRWAGVP